MKEDRPSGYRPARGDARAAHQLLDDPKVLDNPLALSIIGREESRHYAPIRVNPRPRRCRLTFVHSLPPAVAGRKTSSPQPFAGASVSMSL